MKPRVSLPANPNAQQVKNELDRLAESLGETSVNYLFHVSLVTGDQKVAHGFRHGAPMGWRQFSPEGTATVIQYAPPDSNWLYLTASADVRTGIEVF